MTNAVLDTERLITAERVARAADGQGMRTVFQPVVDLSRRTIAGYEALSRFDSLDGIAFAPGEWFTAAAAHALSAELQVPLVQGFYFGRPGEP